MASLKQVLKKFSGRIFSSDELIRLGLDYRTINELLEAGEIFRLHRGVYQLANDDLGEEELFRAATLQLGKHSAVCLLSALSFYHLTDEIPKQVWILVPFEKRTRLPGIKTFRSRKPRWRIGIAKKKGYKITTLERTLVDCLVHPKLRMPIATQALRVALEEKRVSLNKILDMASRLDKTRKVLPLVEIYL